MATPIAAIAAGARVAFVNFRHDDLCASFEDFEQRLHRHRLCAAFVLFFNGPATTEIYTVRNTLSLHDALPICRRGGSGRSTASDRPPGRASRRPDGPRSEEHTSELQSLRTISYAVFCLKK